MGRDGAFRVGQEHPVASRGRPRPADEPTGNLDTASGMGIMELLSELHQGGRTVLVVTHDQRMTNFATRTVHLLDGRIEEDRILRLERTPAEI